MSDNPYSDRVDNINAQQVDGASLSTDVTLGGTGASDSLFPSQKAVFDFVTAVIAGDTPILHDGLENLGYDLSGHVGFQKAMNVYDVDPTQYNDSSQGYVLGQFWYNYNLGTLFFSSDVAINNAVWIRVYTKSEVESFVATTLLDYSNTDKVKAYAIALG